MRKLILMKGTLAAGKSTFALKLRDRFGVTVYSKDRMKEILGDDVGFANREENLKLSKATFDMFLYILKENAPIGTDLLFEANFHQDEMAVIYPLAKELGYDVLTVDVFGDVKVLYDRFMIRLNSEHRHPVHKSAGLSDFGKWKDYYQKDRDVTLYGNVLSLNCDDFAYQDDQAILEKFKQFLGK